MRISNKTRNDPVMLNVHAEKLFHSIHTPVQEVIKGQNHLSSNKELNNNANTRQHVPNEVQFGMT